MPDHSVVGPKHAASLADGVVRNCDAAFGQAVFDIAKAQREPMVAPRCPHDEFGRAAWRGGADQSKVLNSKESLQICAILVLAGRVNSGSDQPNVLNSKASCLAQHERGEVKGRWHRQVE